MAELQNRLSWSNTKAASYSKCAREYYWRAYGSWGGWDRQKASPECWQAYVFNKMKNLPMTVGEMVHHLIEQVLTAHRRNQPIPSIEQSQTNLRNRLRQAWRESKERRWEISPKNFHNFSEHYYGLEPSREMCEQWRDDAYQLIKNFYELNLTRKILSSPPEQIRSVESLEEFRLNDNPLYIKIDLAWFDGQKLHLIDWKTGGPDERVEDQLSAYALFANQQWKVPYEKICCYPIYLRDKTVGNDCLNVENIHRLESLIEEYFASVRAKLADIEQNTAKIDSFAMTEDLWKCRNCFYRQLCGRY